MKELIDFYKDKRVLITGHTGFKGAWLSQILLNFGAVVSGVSLRPATTPNLFGVLSIEDRVKNHFIDIRDYAALKEAFIEENPEIVFHLAAQAIVRYSYDDPLETISTNVVGAANVLQVIKELSGIKSAVIITTDKVYENKEWVHPYRENDPLGGYDPYSASKAAADIVTNSYIQSFFNPKDFKAKHNTLIAIARAGNVIGGGDWAPHRLVPDIIRSIYEKNVNIEIRSPLAIRPWEHVMEPLAGYLMLGKGLYEHNIDFVGPWNFGPNSDSFMTVEKLVSEAVALLDKGKVIIQPDTTKHEANILRLDITKAKSLLGWEPRFHFKQNLQATFDWYKHYYEKNEGIADFTNKQIMDFFK